MCRCAEVRLVPRPEVVGAARRFVLERLTEWSLTELAAPALLLTSELVTNAVLHACSVLDLTVELAAGQLRVAVRDDEPSLPMPATPGLDTEHGRGLALVAALADTWAARPDGSGKRVCFALTIAELPALARSCRCQ